MMALGCRGVCMYVLINVHAFRCVLNGWVHLILCSCLRCVVGRDLYGLCRRTPVAMAIYACALLALNIFLVRVSLYHY